MEREVRGNQRRSKSKKSRRAQQEGGDGGGDGGGDRDGGYDPEQDVVIGRPGYVSRSFENFVGLMARAQTKAPKLHLEYFPLMTLLNPLSSSGAAEGVADTAGSVARDRHDGDDELDEVDEVDEDEDEGDEKEGGGEGGGADRRDLVGDLGMLNDGD